MGGLFGMIGGVIGASAEKKASEKAAKAQVASLQQGIGSENNQWAATQGYYAPYQAAGNQGLAQYGDLLGLHGGGVQQSAIDALKASPYYQSLYNTGKDSVLQNASATGGLRGGNDVTSLYQLGNDTLSQVIQNQLERLSGLGTMGFNTAGQLGQFGTHNADAAASLYQDQGTARAQDYIRRGDINAQMWAGIGGGLDQAVSAFMPGGGGVASLFGG